MNKNYHFFIISSAENNILRTIIFFLLYKMLQIMQMIFLFQYNINKFRNLHNKKIKRLKKTLLYIQIYKMIIILKILKMINLKTKFLIILIIINKYIQQKEILVIY